MKEIYKKIISQFSPQKKSTNSYEREGIRPLRHWKILLSFLGLALIVSGSIAFYFYIAVDKGMIFKTDSTTVEPLVSLNMSFLQQTVNQIKTREEASKNIIQAPPDPSL